MKAFTTIKDLRAWLAPHRGCRIALVPTMGALHAGHLSLIEKARQAADIVVVSIYVNPMQFGPHEDLDTYPRTLDADLAACEQAGVDCIFHPATLYPEDGPRVTVTVAELADCLCGRYRPGHFNGVATVVAILFHIVQPQVAVFGEKDWQQLVVIRRMVADLYFPLAIAAHPTVREADGLALSSRNRYLNKAQRRQAAAIPQALKAMQKACADGHRDAAKLLHIGTSLLEAADIEVEYLDIRHAETLQPLTRLGSAPARAFVAARIGKARLIDNMPLELPCTSPC